ncbi:hypothetical protein GCM10011362_31200 [Marinobacter halophilus]|nr:hypothetical protein GCM10011362_31200 [Marinobacter halophilus]
MCALPVKDAADCLKVWKSISSGFLLLATVAAEARAASMTTKTIAGICEAHKNIVKRRKMAPQIDLEFFIMWACLKRQYLSANAVSLG